MIRLKQKFDPSTYVSYAYTASLFAPFSLPLPGASADSTYPDSLAYLAYLKLPSFSVDPIRETDTFWENMAISIER